MTRIRSRTIQNEAGFRIMLGMHGDMMTMALPAAMERLTHQHSSLSDNEVSDDEEDDDTYMNFGYLKATKERKSPKLNRRISFEDNVEVHTIPSCSAFDEATKRSMWYTREEFHAMRKGAM